MGSRITRFFQIVGAFVVTLACDTACAQSQDRAVCEGELGQRVKTQIEAVAREKGFNGVVLMAKDGEVILAHAVGSSHNEANDPLTTTTLFEIASCTKSFAGAAAVLLQQQGRLNLDDSIAEHLPGVPEHSKSITVRHLIEHTSGIPGDTYGPGTDDVSATVRALLRKAPAHRPGTRHEYWNQGYALLSEVIASASGKSFADFCKEEIFAASNMDSSCFNGDRAPQGATVAIGRATRGQNRSALSHPYSDSYDFSYRAMGGMVTNVWDLWRFTRGLKDKSLLNEQSLKEMTTVGQGDYALGWKIEGQGDDLAWWHTGGVRGFNAVIKYYPNTDSCLFQLANDDDGQKWWPVFQFCDQAVCGKLLAPIDDETLGKIAGSYLAGRRTFTISDEGANPVASFNWGGPTTRGTLGTMDDGRIGFYDGQDNYPVTFEYGGDGKAAGCTVFDTELTRR